MKDIQLVCPHEFRFLLSNVESFRMDLGMNYTKKTDREVSLDIKDKFVIQFKKENLTSIYRCGIIGSMVIYTYSLIPKNELWFYINNVKYVKDFDADEAKFDIERYIGKYLYELSMIE